MAEAKSYAPEVKAYLRGRLESGAFKAWIPADTHVLAKVRKADRATPESGGAGRSAGGCVRG